MKSRFTAILEDGHKGAAVIVPFDPEKQWKRAPTPVFSPVYGKEMLGIPVRGTLAGHRFSGWVGHRWGRHFVLVDEALQRAARVAVGDSVEVVLEPVRATRKPARRSPKSPP